MIIYLLLEGLDSILFFVISLFPTIETPLWLANSLPQIFRYIVGFNLYLPVFEAFQVVSFVLLTTIAFRVFSIVSSLVHLDI